MHERNCYFEVAGNCLPRCLFTSKRTQSGDNDAAATKNDPNKSLRALGFRSKQM